MVQVTERIGVSKNKRKRRIKLSSTASDTVKPERGLQEQGMIELAAPDITEEGDDDKEINDDHDDDNNKENINDVEDVNDDKLVDLEN